MSSSSRQRPNAEVSAVIGSGQQAWTQLWALTAVGTATELRMYTSTGSEEDGSDVGRSANAV